MPRRAPKDPEALIAMISALRALADGDQGSEFTNAAVSKLKQSGAKGDAARRLVHRFDGLEPAAKTEAFGSHAERRDFAMGSRADRVRTINEAAERRMFEHFGRGGTTASEEGGGGAGSRGIPDVRGPLDNPVLTDHIGPSTYEIRYEGLHCIDESGSTNWGSDEIYVITSSAHITADGQNVVRTETHPVGQSNYGDVDTGETRRGPVAACWHGTDLPVSLSVVAFEHDHGDPDHYRDEIDAVVKAALVVGALLFGAGATAKAILTAVGPLITDAINWLFDTDDDQIDNAKTEVFDQARLEALGKQPAGPYPHTELYGHFFSEHNGDGARYAFAFKLYRDPAFVEEIFLL
jgi:hypothetical protein